MDGKRRLVRVRAGLASALLVFATLAEAGTGSSGWSTWRRVQAPRPRGIISVIGVRGDLSGVLSNPSVLSSIPKPELFSFAERGLTKDVFGGLLFGQPLNGGKAGGLAVGAMYYNAGSLDLTYFDPITKAETTKSVSGQSDVIGMIAYGVPVGNTLGLGITAKMGTSSVAEAVSAVAAALDLGGWWQSPVDGLSFGGGVQNLGISGAFIKSRESLPLIGSLGAGYTRRIGQDMSGTIGVDANYLAPESRVLGQTGLEIGWKGYSVLGGYRFGAKDAQFTVGVGVRLGSIDFSYAFLPGRFLNDVHRIGLGYQFAASSKQKSGR